MLGASKPSSTLWAKYLLHIAILIGGSISGGELNRIWMMLVAAFGGVRGFSDPVGLAFLSSGQKLLSPCCIPGWLGHGQIHNILPANYFWDKIQLQEKV